MAIYGYTRVSTAEQAGEEKTSLAEQERRIQGAAMVHGARVERTFQDAGVSGTVPLFLRDGGKNLERALKKGDTVIASKMDRMFRSNADAVQTVDIMQKKGVGVILLDMGTDPVTEGPVSRMFFAIMAAVAEFDRCRIIERNQEGKRGKKARGGYIGGHAPFGYRVVGQGTESKLVEDAHEQQILGAIRQFNSGHPVRDISRAVGDNPRTGRAFHPQTISRLLKRAS